VSVCRNNATVAQTAAEQLRTIREELADPVAEEFHRAHERYEAVCKEIEDLGLAEAVWKWRERREKEWQNILEVQVPELPYCGLNTLPRWQAAARDAHASVDQDERALAQRRAEMVLNKYLARELDKGWQVRRRWKLHAFIARKPSFWKDWVLEVGVDPSGKVNSTKVRTGEPTMSANTNFLTSVGVVTVNTEIDHTLSFTPCKYCWGDEDQEGCKERCGGTTGELELFP